MDPASHIDSYYAATLPPRDALSALSGNKRAQVCIIGGGLAGLTCGRELARAGVEAIVLETNRVGWGASGRNGGFVSEGFAEGMDQIIARVGLAQARSLFAQSKRGMDYVRVAIEGSGRDDILQGQGGLKLIRHGGSRALQRSAAAMQENFGVTREFWPADRIQSVIHSKIYTAGMYNPDAFHIHPLRYAEMLAADAQALGLTVHENSRALRLSRSSDQDGRWKVETAAGAVTADHVVMASSVYGGVFAPLERAMVPVATYVVSSHPLGPRLDGVIDFRGTMADSRRAGDYFRVVGEGDERRLIWGGRITTRRAQPRHLSNMLKQDIARVFPQIGDLEIDHAWSGLMAYCRHKMPLIGMLWPQSHPGIWACTGFGGHGLNTTTMGGCLIADAIAKGDEEWKIFAPYRPTWTGGPVGRIASQLAYWQMQWQDRRDEAATKP